MSRRQQPPVKTQGRAPSLEQQAFVQGLRLQQAGDFGPAERLYRQALVIDPRHADSLHMLGVLALQSGRPEVAAELIGKAIAIKGKEAPFHSNLGLVLLSLGLPEDAAASCRKALKLKPDYAEAANNLGLVLKSLGRTEEARHWFHRALDLKPDYLAPRDNLDQMPHPETAIAAVQAPDLQAIFAEAFCHHQANRLTEATQLYQHILSIKTDHADSLHLLGVAAFQSGQFQQAVALIGRAITINDKKATYHSDLGLALQEVGRAEEAEACHRQALILQPDYPAAHSNLGNALKALGRHEEAEFCHRRAIALKPDFANAYNSLGTVLIELGRPEEAIPCYRKALALQADFANALNNLGTVLTQQGRPEEAVDNFRRALALRPNFADTLANLGVALLGLGQKEEALATLRQALLHEPTTAEAFTIVGVALMELDLRQEALTCFNKALEKKPDHALALCHLVHQRHHICDWSGLADLELQLLQIIRDSKGVAPPFPLLAIPSSPADQLACAQAFSGTFRTSSPALAGHRPRRPGEKIRLGYLSADYHDHATAYLIAELIECHDRDRFDVSGYSCGADDGGAMRRRLVAGFDHFVDVGPLSNQDAAQRIHRDGIDILIDLKGFTTNARPTILAHRPAPVQVNFLGYPGTMGVDFVDYVIADSFCLPQGQDIYYAEKVVRLPGCYQPNDSMRKIARKTPPRAEYGLPEDGFVFCCFNNSYKITEDVFDVWMRLLRQVPGSVLWLLEANASAKANLRHEAAKRDVSPDRLLFAPFRPLPEHLARYRLADLFLDTQPYNAHTTASDALWAGLPVLTCAGQTFASRVAGSLLTAMKLPELITETLADYQAKALDLARDRTRLNAIRAKVKRNRTTTSLFNIENFGRDIERAYERMWEIQCQGHPAEAFSLGPRLP